MAQAFKCDICNSLTEGEPIEISFFVPDFEARKLMHYGYNQSKPRVVPFPFKGVKQSCIPCAAEIGQLIVDLGQLIVNRGNTK